MLIIQIDICKQFWMNDNKSHLFSSLNTRCLKCQLYWRIQKCQPQRALFHIIPCS